MNFTFSKKLPSPVIQVKQTTLNQLTPLEKKLNQLQANQPKVVFGNIFQNLRNASSCSSCGK